jgi:hypothetical protein
MIMTMRGGDGVRLFYVATFVFGMLGGAAVGLVWTI